jgi:CheY-like chemotaxis protein/HPt (histidine-containing phosphotransfer) domain-containing protein
MFRPLAESAVQTFFHTASAKGVLLRCEVDERVSRAHVGDALRLRQILSNFISNAVKFTSTGSISLGVRVLSDDGVTQALELSVTDTGIGVAPERQQELFEEFVQADATTAAQAGGTGLGLVICRRLAALMGGDVRMESTPGRGTTMYLTVRLAVADPADVGAGTGAALGGAAEFLRRPKPAREVAERERSVLLLAEDHPINRRVLVQQLGMIGFHVDTAEDGQEALALFEAGQGRYALVLTDINMPVMDGFELARAIRRMEAEAGGSRTPIMALSANVLPGQAERCANAGMDDFAGKPSSMPVLAEKLRRWMPHVDWSAEPEPVAAGPTETGGGGPGQDGVIDSTVLDELTGGDHELAAAILVDYVDSLGSDLSALRAGLDATTADDVRRVAHRIKGASGTVGAHVVATVAGQLESIASAEVANWSAMRAGAEDLETEVARVAASVRTAPAAP